MARTIARAARIAFTLVMMNCAVIAGLFVAARGRQTWR